MGYTRIEAEAGGPSARRIGPNDIRDNSDGREGELARS